MLDQITPLILTYNEEKNIRRTIDKLYWAKQIIVIDSNSNDSTIEILREYPVVKIITRKFDSFADQCNFGLENILSEWVLSLDADYVLTESLISEIRELHCIKSEISAYKVSFKYCVFGKPLTGTLLPPRTVLYKRSCAHYQNDGHAHRVFIKGKVESLSAFIFHDDRKPLSRWIAAQDRYMIQEVEKLFNTPYQHLGLADKLRMKKFITPFLIFFYCLVVKGGIFDSWHGWYYAYQRVLAEILLSIRIMEFENSLQEKERA